MANIEFNIIDYVTALTENNRLCVDNRFKAVTCSGPDNLEGVIEEYRRTANFIVIDDTTDNNVFCTRPGFQTRSVYTVWVLASYNQKDLQERADKMQLCRTVFRQFLSKFIKDKAEMAYPDMVFLNLDNVMYKELPRYSFNGVTGLWFMIANDVPTDLRYVEEEWL